MARYRRPRDATDDAPPARITGESLHEAARLLRYLLPYRAKFAAAQACLLISTLAGLTFPYFTGRLIDSAQRAIVAVPQPTNGSLTEQSASSIALVLVLVVAVQAACSFFQTYWVAEACERSLVDLRQDIYSHLISLPMVFFTQRRVGELASRLGSDLTIIQGLLTVVAPQFLSQLTVLVGGIVLIALTSVRLTLVMLISLPVVIGMTAVFGRATRAVSREAQDKLADTNVVVEETLQGIASVKAYTNEGFEVARYRAGIQALIGAVLRGARYQGALAAFVMFALFGSIVLVMWYGAVLVEARQLTFGQLTQFFLYTMYIGGTIGNSARLLGELQRIVGATQRVRELLREPTEEAGAASSSAPGKADAGSSSHRRLTGDVVFESVTFSYPSRREATVLRDLSLHANAGERIALVGPSGAGKSTIVSLLLRFYDPDSGRVLIDGRDARDYPLRGLREHMAIVPQDVLLFGGTIADNIAYGRPGASLPEIEEAARNANAHDFIVGFPEGYQTLVGDRGVKLSGGQRQRVAIARAILRNPAILILDEATSSLDSESESLVQHALDSLMQGRTSVIIAHRLATVRRADHIFVIKEGQVVESGTHDQLLTRESGLYRTLSELQFDPGE
jgi:ABC-type multidrug transport system fused ATPase/permease subunit